jgi:Ribosomal protein S4/S9 N-terminal domain
MSRYTGPACRLCRREGTKLFLKGTRCFTEKCAVDRRGYAPGQHGASGGGKGGARKMSEYAKQLREKQKVKRIYGLNETQFRNTFETATHEPGVKGTNLLVALESRLDNLVYRMGFTTSRRGRANWFGTGTSRWRAIESTFPPIGFGWGRKFGSPRPRTNWCRSRSRRRWPREAPR